MEENIKLNRVKKLTKVAEIILKVGEIIALVGTIIMLVMSIGMLGFPTVFEKSMNESGSISYTVNPDSLLKIHFFDISSDNVVNFVKENIESDIPFIREWIDNGEIIKIMGITFIIYTLLLASLYVWIMFFRKIFTRINKEGSPFRQGVIRQMRVSFIVMSAILLTSFGTMGGIVVAIALWCIYLIFDYGFCLQELADETL